MYTKPEMWQDNSKFHKYRYKLVNSKLEIQNIPKFEWC